MTEMSMATTATVKPQKLTEEESQRLTKLVAKAQTGNASALKEARPILDKADLWDYVGDLGGRVRELWLDAMTGQDKLAREAYERHVDMMRRELLEAGDSAIERLLVDRVIVTWLQVCQADMAGSSGIVRSLSARERAFQNQRLDRANARHLKAVASLAGVRRLLVPAVQLNIARNQIINQ